MFRGDQRPSAHHAASTHSTTQGLSPNEHVNLNNEVANDIFNNEIKYERSLVGFYVRSDARLKLDSCTYKNQLFLMLDQMARIGNFSMYINAIEFRSKYRPRQECA